MAVDWLPADSQRREAAEGRHDHISAFTIGAYGGQVSGLEACHCCLQEKKLDGWGRVGYAIVT